MILGISLAAGTARLLIHPGNHAQRAPRPQMQLLRDLREQDVDIATIGQYLQPTRRNLQVTEYVAPEQFEHYRDFGLSLGFKMVFSGPLVRSSYMADLVHQQAGHA